MIIVRRHDVVDVGGKHVLVEGWLDFFLINGRQMLVDMGLDHFTVLCLRIIANLIHRRLDMGSIHCLCAINEAVAR